MGLEIVPLPAKLVMGILWVGEDGLRFARMKAEDLFGPVDRQSDRVLFEQYTSYYEPEMGKGIQRCYWSFSDLVPPGSLAEIKLATNRIEAELSSGAGRKVNLDPGLLTLDSLVLATTKPYYHRTYLGKGIHADLSLVYRRGNFECLPWTYPDYREPWVRDFFLGVRKILKEESRSGEGRR